MEVLFGSLFYVFFFYFQYISYTVVNKCTTPTRKTGHESTNLKSKKIATFHFPIKNPDFIN